MVLDNDAPPMSGRFDHDAEFLRQQEFERLAAATVPTLESLRFLNPTQLRARVAGMLERRGYELLTPETAEDLLAIKDGEKCVVAFASTSDPAPTQANHMIELHRLVIDTSAAKGFYVTTRGFSRAAEAYAKTAPLNMVDGPKLVALIKRSMEGIPTPESYKTMCRQCGEIVTHRLDRTEAIACKSGHPVAPTIAGASLNVGPAQADRPAVPTNRRATTLAAKSARTTPNMRRARRRSASRPRRRNPPPTTPPGQILSGPSESQHPPALSSHQLPPRSAHMVRAQ